MKSEIRTETFKMDQSATEAGTHSGRIQSFRIHRLENWCEEKVFKVIYMNTICNAFKVEHEYYM